MADDTTVTLQLCQGLHRLVLEKAGHRWAFQWEPGLKHTLIEQIGAMAEDPNCPLGWVEAAIVCRYLGRRTPVGWSDPTKLKRSAE